MQMIKDQLQTLLNKYAAGELAPEEQEELKALLSGSQGAELADIVAQMMGDEKATLTPLPEKIKRALFEQIISVDKPRTATSVSNVPSVHRIHFLRRWGWAAACVLLVLSMGAYFLIRDNPQAKPQLAGHASMEEDVPPGREGAILTLDDGTEVILDSLGNGVIANQNGSELVIKDGQLLYNSTGNVSGAITHNMIRTPKGRQFQVVLPDGSKVWLNAASSIRYPTVFAGNERRVDIEGEVYFEVAKLTQLPFVVNVNGQTEVEVLGTSFNVSAYSDESSIYTTLIDGAIAIRKKDKRYLLKPGQQTNQTANHINLASDVDVEKVLAWKNGLFNFNGASLEQVLKQLSRWYSLDVRFQSTWPEIYFEGKISRNVQLSSVLTTLKESGVKFRLEEGNRLVILP